MMLRKKLQTLLTGLMIVFGGLALVAPVANAQSKEDICKGVGIVSGSSGGSNCATPAGSTTVESVVAKVVNILSLVVGIVAVIMVIIGGFKYIISSGDSNNLNSAKNTILFAIVGLIVVAVAQVIVRFVLNNVTE